MMAMAFAGVVLAQATEPAPTPEAIQLGSKIYQNNCSPCHGSRMADPQGAFDLRTFPRDAKPRFVQSVTKGKNSMPPWGDLFNASEIDALWAYTIAGEK
jgi:mono/diheme cytochrome c family protein